MKKPTILLSLLAAPLLLLFAFQYYYHPLPATADLPYIKSSADKQWFKMKEDAHITSNDLLEKYSSHLGIHAPADWRLYRSEVDDLGMSHDRYQLYYDDIPVEGAELLVHSVQGEVRHFNGCWIPDMQVQMSVALSADDAIQVALNEVPAQRYAWEDAGAERLLKMVRRDPEATAYPQPELVCYSPTFPRKGAAFKAAYKLIVQAYKPLTRTLLYIDASSGHILDRMELLEHVNTPAIAETRYHGTQSIITDSIAPDSFILYETTRGHGVHTMNLQGSDEPEDAVEFSDEDNYWNNYNDQQDEVATDAHFSAEMTFDFLDQHLGHVGVDGDSMQLLCLVHYGENVVNAFWNGDWCTLGDGDGDLWTPLTSLDVVGHEFGHGVTQNTANLIYRDEHGALNESFSDILGAAVEFWGEPDSADYLVGEDFHFLGEGFRNMSKPNEREDPDTYLGNFWVTGNQDNGGVHSNSGVQNYWFYLLAEGGTGTNDNGYQYDVQGLGIDTASLIAFRNLKYYLSRFSEYADARLGSMIAAEDLYGPCSFAAQQTVNAWRAVGVGYLYDYLDFEMIDFVGLDSLNCGLSNSEHPTIRMRYNDCLNPLGDSSLIPLEIVVDNGDIQYDTILLLNGIQGGDTLTYTLSSGISGLETMGLHYISVTVVQPLDSIGQNNTTSYLLENVLQQNSDFKDAQVWQPAPACFMQQVPVSVEITFLGCTEIESGEELFFSYAHNGEVVTESYILPAGLSRDESFVYTFDTPLDATDFLGITDIDTWVDYPDDFIFVNDSLSAKVVNPKHTVVNQLLNFESVDLVVDSFYTLTTPYSDIYLSEYAAFESDYGLYMTGNDPTYLIDNEILVAPTSEDMAWQVNEELSAKFCICADAQAYGSLVLSFDIRQVHSQILLSYLDGSNTFASSMRILINSQQASPTYFTEMPLGQFHHEVLDISDYAGELLEICFESRCVSDSDFGGLGDRVYLDNILLSGAVATHNMPKEVFSFSISPNPNDGNFSIRYENHQGGRLSLMLYDAQGRVCKEGVFQKAAGNGHIALETQALAKGIYFLTLNVGSKMINKKVVVF